MIARSHHKLPLVNCGLVFNGLLLYISLLPMLAHGEEVFDHNAQHCHDVSIWGPVEYKDEICTKCETEFEQVCLERIKNVCAEVPITRCELILYTECRYFTEESYYNETVIVPTGEYVPWECSNFTKLETHVKLVPKCVNVTRQDCVTKWVVTPTGEKVWAGNEDCRPVSWMNCTLHKVPKEFNQTYTKCKRSGVPIPTMICELREKSRVLSGTKCEVKQAVNCSCDHSRECKEIIYEECLEVAKPLQCQRTSMKTPYQPKIHRVKCLLATDGDAPAIEAEESGREADLILEEDSVEYNNNQ